MKKGFIAMSFGAFMLLSAPVIANTLAADTDVVFNENEKKAKKSKKKGKSCNTAAKKKGCCASAAKASCGDKAKKEEKK